MQWLFCWARKQGEAIEAVDGLDGTAWEGGGDTIGKPLSLSPEAVECLMGLDDIAAAFWDRGTAPVAAVAAEGNG
jgi:hypothetical protein